MEPVSDPKASEGFLARELWDLFWKWKKEKEPQAPNPGAPSDTVPSETMDAALTICAKEMLSRDK